VLLRRPPVWRVTNSMDELPAPAEFLMPQIALLLVNVTAIAVGLAVVQDGLTTTISVALCLLHVAVLARVLLQAAGDRRRSISADVPAPTPVAAPAAAG